MSAQLLEQAGVPFNYEFSDDKCHQVPNYNELEYDIHADAIALCPAPGASCCPSQLRDYRRHNHQVLNYHELAPGASWFPY